MGFAGLEHAIRSRSRDHTQSLSAELSELNFSLDFLRLDQLKLLNGRTLLMIVTVHLVHHSDLLALSARLGGGWGLHARALCLFGAWGLGDRSAVGGARGEVTELGFGGLLELGEVLTNELISILYE